MAVSHVFSSPVADFTGTVTVFNSAGGTETKNATEIVRPSNWNSVHNQFITLGGNTAGVSTLSGTNIELHGGNNLTLSGVGGSIIFSASLGLTSQSNQAFSANGGSSAFQTLVFADSQGISFSNSNGSLVGTVRTNYASSSHSHGNPTLALTNLTGTTDSNSNGLTLSLSAAAPQTGISGIQVSDTTYTSGTITFRNANGISFGSSGANGVSASYTVPTQSAQTIGVYASSNTTGQSSSSTVDARSLTFRGMGVASVGMSAGEVIISVPAGGGGGFSGGMSTEGNTAGTTSVVSNRLIFVGSGAISLSQSANGASATLSILGPATSSLSATGALSVSSNGATISMGVGTVTAFATSNTTQASSGTIDLGSLLFQARGGVSMGISNGSIVVSGGAGGAETQTGISGIEVSNTTYTSGTVTFRNANGISFGSSGANGISASYTVPTVTNSSMTISDAATSGTLARLAFTNLNGVTLSLSTGAGGSHTIVGSHNALTSQSNQAFSAGAASSAFQTLIFQDSLNLSFSNNAGSLRVTHNLAGTSTGFAGANISGSMTLNSSGLNLSLSVAAPGAAAENNWHHLLGANTAGNTTVSGSTIGVSGINLTLSGTNGSVFNISAPATSSLVGVSGVLVSTNGSTISIYGQPGSYFANMPYLLNSQSQTVGQSTSVVFPFDQKEVEHVGFMNLIHTVSLASTSFASTANAVYSFNQAETHNLVLYTRGTGASSMSLQSIGSSSVGVTFSMRLSRNTTNNISVTHALSFPVSNGTSSLSFSYAATNSTDQFSTTHLTALSGMKLWDTQFATTLQGGIYWLAYGVSTSSTTQSTNLSGARLLHSHIAMSMPNLTMGNFGLANAASVAIRPGIGSFSTAGGGTTASMPISAISSSSSHNVPMLQMQRIA